MKFNDSIKNRGKWCDYATELDNMAYYLYLSKKSNISILQVSMINSHYSYNPLISYNYWYDKASKYLRKNKIEKIKCRLQEIL